MKTKREVTVKQLRELLKDCPDDAVVYIHDPRDSHTANVVGISTPKDKGDPHPVLIVGGSL